MGGRAWQFAECELFKAHIGDDDWLNALSTALPHRTIYALRMQMSKIRGELGILIHKVGWKAHELELLEEHIDDENWLAAVQPAFPDRTPNALKVQMSKLRVELGYADGRECDAGWMQNAREAAPRLLEATLRVGMWT